MTASEWCLYSKIRYNFNEIPDSSIWSSLVSIIKHHIWSSCSWHLQYKEHPSSYGHLYVRVQSRCNLEELFCAFQPPTQRRSMMMHCFHSFPYLMRAEGRRANSTFISKRIWSLQRATVIRQFRKVRLLLPVLILSPPPFCIHFVNPSLSFPTPSTALSVYFSSSLRLFIWLMVSGRCWKIIFHIVPMTNILFMSYLCCVSFVISWDRLIYIYNFWLSVSAVCLFCRPYASMSQTLSVCVGVSGHLFPIGSGPHSQSFVFLCRLWDQEDRYVPDLLLRCTVPYPHCWGPIGHLDSEDFLNYRHPGRHRGDLFESEINDNVSLKNMIQCNLHVGGFLALRCPSRYPLAFKCFKSTCHPTKWPVRNQNLHVLDWTWRCLSRFS